MTTVLIIALLCVMVWSTCEITWVTKYNQMGKEEENIKKQTIKESTKFVYPFVYSFTIS